MNVHTSFAHEMKILDSSGHTTVTWNPDVPDSIAAAQREFERLRREGYAAFAMEVVVENGVVVEEKGEILRRFDATLGKVLMVPNRQGG